MNYLYFYPDLSLKFNWADTLYSSLAPDPPPKAALVTAFLISPDINSILPVSQKNKYEQVEGEQANKAH